ncbi:hypothetical protein GPZ77_30210 [Streptomyces sp. QHH-9511]|uniref:SCO2400 family protein n=1 Tax=Streptomyces sp. QHH-9511 TaxID=2684468 RepID=UPI0013193431|nr:hypothetical protein [Streptomyces sp. QHH-9511]QGZ52072.1 hypothetical protein GPZ77_30210 [Streptomyces sp. QHH-9511]
MDYCSSCRRHLNGALVCPGCGAHAPDIAPVVTAGRPLSVAATTVTTSEAAPAAWHGGRPHGETAAGTVPEEGLRDDSPADLAGVPSVPEGRAARRRQRVRWKKNQRRAVVATAVALVGGGLTMTAMDRQGGDRAQAATAPQDPGMGAAEEQAAQDARPASTPPHTRPAPPVSQAAPPAPDVPRPDSAVAPPTTPPDARPGPAASPETQAAPAHQPQSASPASAQPALDRASDTSTPGTTASQAPAPAAPADDSGTESTGSGTSQASTSPTATAPSEVCLLVVCLPLSRA